jgi:hypothetical protein
MESSGGDYGLETGKHINDVSSYRPTSLLPIMSKLFEKLVLKRLTPILDANQIIPQHQFGFLHQHSTLDQVNRITAIIEQALEEKQVCATMFLDVAQAFDKVWNAGLLNKIEQLLPTEYSQLLNLTSPTVTSGLNKGKSTLTSNLSKQECHK